jgi:hypothetical protein
LGILDDDVDIIGAWETIRENIKISKLVDPRKQAKLQWLQNPSKITEDNLNILRPEDK